MINIKKIQAISLLSLDIKPSDDILKNLEPFLQHKTDGYRKIFSILLLLQNRFRHFWIYPNQTTVGEMAGGYSRGYTNRIIKELAADGFLLRYNRGVKKTCLYKISSFLNNSFIRSRLRTILNPRVFLALTLLISKPFGNNDRMQNVTQQVNIKSIMNNINNTTVPQLVQNIANKYNFSLAGCYKLMAFPDDAILYAVDKEKFNLAKIRDPLAWYLHTCKNYCESENLNPNWALYYKLMELAKLPIASSHYLTEEEIANNKKQKILVASEHVRNVRKEATNNHNRVRNYQNYSKKTERVSENNNVDRSEESKLRMEKHLVQNKKLTDDIKLNKEFNQFIDALFSERWESLEPQKRDELISLANEQISSTDIMLGMQKIKTNCYLRKLVLSDEERDKKIFAFKNGFSLPNSNLCIN